MFVEGIIEIDGVYYIQGKSVDENTTFTLPFSSIKLMKRLRVRLKSKVKVRVKSDTFGTDDVSAFRRRNKKDAKFNLLEGVAKAALKKGNFGSEENG